MKKNILFLFVLASALLITGAGCSKQQTDQPQIPSSTPVVKQAATNTGTIYKNDKYGFLLEFPNTWNNHIVKSRVLNWESLGTSDSIDFGFSAQDSLFNISVHSKDQWKKLSLEGEGALPTYLGENNKYVFAYGVAQFTANDTMIAKMGEIKNIMKTFAIIQQPVQSISCVDEPEGKPVVTSLSIISGLVGTKLEINGCNFSGFEGDKNAWIKNNKGAIGILRGEEGSTSKLLLVTLKSPLCQKDVSYSGLSCDTWLTLIPGKYNIYVAPWGKESNKMEFTIDQSIVKNTSITYYVLEKKNVNETFCNGADMDEVGFKAALTKQINVTVPGNLTIEERIIKTLSLAAVANSFESSYARVDEVAYKNNVVSMGPANGWAGSSIFYCAWKPFVEKNLEQFSDVKEIIWDAFPDTIPKKY